MSHVESERNGGVLYLAIDRPEKKNALTADMYEALATRAGTGGSRRLGARDLAAWQGRRFHRGATTWKTS